MNRSRLEDIINAVLFISILVGIWQLIYILHIWPPYIVPSPIQTMERFYVMLNNGTLLPSIGITLLRLLMGFSLSVVIGGTLGLAMIFFKGFGKVMSSFNLGLLSYPSIAWVPFSILLLGFNEYGILLVIILSSIFSMATATYSGIRNISPLYIKAARNMGANGITLFKEVMLPASMPSLIAGVRQTWSFAWHAVVGAEMLMSTIGLGAILMFGREYHLMTQVIVSMIVLFIIGFLSDRLIFGIIEERIRKKWGLT